MNDFPPLPEPASVSVANGDPGSVSLRDNYSAFQMRAYVEADRAQRQAEQRFALNPDNGMMYESDRGPWCLYKDAAPQPAQSDKDAEIAALRDALTSLLDSVTNSECGEVDRRLSVQDARITLRIPLR